MFTFFRKFLSPLASLALFVIVLLIAGCGPAAPSLPGDNDESRAYPAPLTQVAVEAYPGSPAPTRTGTLLALNRPIEPGQTQVTGVGPPGLPIIIANITFLGEQIGSGVVDSDGFFSVNVSPIPAGVRLGLTADLERAGLTESDVRPGEGEISFPRVGYFYDSVVISQPE